MRRGLFLVTAIATLLVAAPAQAALDLEPDLPSVTSRAVPAPRLVLPRASGGLQWGGGSVLHSNRTHVVFWQPAGSGLTFDPGYLQQVETFLARVAQDSHLPTNVYSLTGQYTDGGGPAAYDSRYAGAIFDTDPLPPQECSEPLPPPLGEGPGWNTCVTDDQIQAELTTVASVHHLPVTLGDVYFLVTPNGLGSCIGGSCALGGSDNHGFCGYHDVTVDDLLYAVIPYNAVAGHCQSDAPRPNASPADPTLSSLSHEHNEVITDPLQSGWAGTGGYENGDLCQDQSAHHASALGGSGDSAWDQVIGGGRYWLQLEWSNEDGGCTARDEPDPLSLSPPRRPVAGRSATLGARGRDPDGSIVGYFWSLGDGTFARGATVHHTYRRTGRYLVIVRSTDSAGNWSFAGTAVSVQRAPASHRHRRPTRHRPRAR